MSTLSSGSPSVHTSVAIFGHVEAVRASHRKLTGRELAWPDAIQLIDRYNATIDDDMPPKVFEVTIGCFLIQESYSPEAIRRVVTHVAIYGRAAGSLDLDAADVEAVDMLLPAR